MEENEKRDINMVAMEVIMNAGDGRDKIDEALAAVKSIVEKQLG